MPLLDAEHFCAFIQALSIYLGRKYMLLIFSQQPALPSGSIAGGAVRCELGYLLSVRFFCIILTKISIFPELFN